MLTFTAIVTAITEELTLAARIAAMRADYRPFTVDVSPVTGAWTVTTVDAPLRVGDWRMAVGNPRYAVPNIRTTLVPLFRFRAVIPAPAEGGSLARPPIDTWGYPQHISPTPTPHHTNRSTHEPTIHRQHGR